jgi:parallel beta-helix repeat protein
VRPRIVAVSAATLIAAASISPIAAQAAGQNTIYVNGASPACTDSGTGTATAPYCTLQAAADAASPGDLVSVTPGTYAAATITRSGTASDPIVFTGNGTWTNLGMTTAAVTAFDVSGASHVRIQNFALAPGAAADAVVDGGADVTFRNDIFRGTVLALPALHVTDAASGVTVLDSNVFGEVLVDGGSTGTVLTTDRLSPSYTSPGIAVVGAVNTAITSNTITGCGPAVSITGSATGTAIENNVLSNPQTVGTVATCPASSQAYGIAVDASSVASTTEDYNDVYAATAGSAAYDWAGTAYASAAGLYAVAGRALHDDNSALGTEAIENSPLINSADSAAIGEQPVDISGHPRILDPLVTPTGAGPYDYYDRGAVQYQDPVTKVSSSFTGSVAKAPVGADITLKAAFTDTWSDTFDYQFKLSNGTTVDAGTSGTAAVSFSTPGVYIASLYVVPTNGATAPTQAMGTVAFSVVPQTPLVAQVSTTAFDRYSVSAGDFGTTDAWTITSVTLDFGDHTRSSLSPTAYRWTTRTPRPARTRSPRR